MNQLGLGGAIFLSEQIGEMKALTKLNLAECNMSDKGVTILLKGLAPLL